MGQFAGSVPSAAAHRRLGGIDFLE